MTRSAVSKSASASELTRRTPPAFLRKSFSTLSRRVLASSCYPAFFRGHQRVGTPEFLSMMRLRKIWVEGSFSVLKREHCISKIRKRGILAASEECLLAAMALNLKRMASAVFFYLHISCSAVTTVGFGSFFAFVNGSLHIHNLRS